MTIHSLEEAIYIGEERIQRANGDITRLYIIQVGNEAYILCTEAYLPYLLQEYGRYYIAKVLEC